MLLDWALRWPLAASDCTGGRVEFLSRNLRMRCSKQTRTSFYILSERGEFGLSQAGLNTRASQTSLQWKKFESVNAILEYFQVNSV